MNIFTKNLYGITNQEGTLFFNHYCESGNFSDCYNDKIRNFFYQTEKEAKKEFILMKDNILRKNLDLRVVKISVKLELEKV